MALSKQTLIEANVFIQRCLSLGMIGDLESFLIALSNDADESLEDILSVVRELNRPSPLNKKIQKARENLGMIPVADVDLVLKHLEAFKAVVQTHVRSNGLSATARKVGMNPANLAALLKANHKPRFETIRKIAVALGITAFPIKKSKLKRK